MRIQMKLKLSILVVIFLSGCAGMGNSPIAQSLHGERVSKETDSTLCLRYLAGRNNLSNQVREIEIKKRSLNCSTVVSARDVEIERRLRKAEEAAEDAEREARNAKRAADEAERRSQRIQLCSRGLKAYCF
jgi:hypothetical protein